MWQYSLGGLPATWNGSQSVSENISQNTDLHNQYVTSPMVFQATPNDEVVLLVVCSLTVDRTHGYVPVVPIVDPGPATTHILWLGFSCMICWDVIHEALSQSIHDP